MRCTACGARNSEDATWCTQCYAQMGEQAPDGPPAPTPERPTDPAGRPPPPPPPSIGATQRDVRQRAGAVEWRCPACDGWSALESADCRVCGTPRQGFGEPDTTLPDRSDRSIVGASLLLPGLGHILAGRTGAGVARVLLAGLWVIGGVAFVAGNPGLHGLPGWLLLGGAATLWAATVVDAQRIVAGDARPVLGTRGFAGLVLTVTMGLVVSVGVVVLLGS